MKAFAKTVLQRFDVIVRTPELRIYFISIFALVIISTVLIYFNNQGKTYDLRVGDIASEDIKVSRDIHYVNQDETNILRTQVRHTVLPVFDVDGSVVRGKLEAVDILFDTMDAVLRENPPLGTNDLTFQLVALKSRLPRNMQFDDSVLLNLMRYGSFHTVKDASRKVINYIYDRNSIGILNKEYENNLELESDVLVVRIHDADSFSELTRKREILVAVEDIKKDIFSITRSVAPHLPRSVLSSVASVIRDGLEPNMRFNYDETKRRINERMKNIKPAMSILKKNQVIIREGDIVTSETINLINVLNSRATSSISSFIAGVFLLQIIFMVIFGYFMIEHNRVLIPEIKSSIIIFTVMVVFMAYTFMVVKLNVLSEPRFLYVFLLPTSFVTMLVALLYNRFLGLILTVYIVFFSTMMVGGDFLVAVMGFSSALLGIAATGNMERRTDFLKGGFVIGAMMAAITLAIALFESIPLAGMVKKMYFPFAHGLINAILVMGFLPLFENVFGITTKFRLMELADLNAKIFKNMLVKAPGTYNHSLIVANMAETASRDIYANSLLARVGAYYHDIGKIEDADIYIENRRNGAAQHIADPGEYASMIMSHVQKGVDLAHKNSLPQSVIDFIREHHGQSVMTFFYHQALEKAKKKGKSQKICKEDYQYPGPRPHSKEIAIVMLADSIEAASRTLHEPTPPELRKLVQKIISTKLNDGELSYSDLSMSELKKVERSFLRIMNGVFHARIEYPEQAEVKLLEKEVQRQHG